MHGGVGFGNRNVEGEMVLEFADAMNLVITNTWFVKDEAQVVTYESGGCRTVVDYILVRKCDRNMVKDAKVIPGESCIPQHRLLVGVVVIEECVRKKREKFVQRCKVWKLKEAELQDKFEKGVLARAEGRVDGDVEEVWSGLKDCFLEVANEVCGKTKGPQRRKETWWWNKEVAEVVKEKRRLFKIFDKSKKVDDKKTVEANGKIYHVAKCEARRVIFKAQEAERKRFGEELDNENEKGNVFRVAKQIVNRNKDVVGAGCVKDTDGNVVVDDEKLMEVWRAYYDKLSNEEFSWSKDSLAETSMVSGPSESISIKEVEAAIAKMKNNKAAGPSGVVADMVKAAGEVGLMWVTDVCNAVVRDGRIPEDWTKSWMVNVYKGKGDALECGSYRGIKLLEHVMKILERVIDRRVRDMVKIDDMQFGFMAGKGTTDAIFIVRQLQEKYMAKKKDLWMAFVDLEKAFDRVPRDVVWWALRSLGVDEWLVSVIKAMYVDTSTMVRIGGKVSKAFGVRVGVHQGSVLSPLLFIIVLEALSREFREGLPMELLYADDLVLMSETEEQLIVKLRKWKEGMEAKGLRVNLGKTKVMRCRVGTGQIEKSGKFPCSVCSKGVGVNSIQCTECNAWVHGKKACSGIIGSLSKVVGFRCKKCVGGIPALVEVVKEIHLGPNAKVEGVEKFCYLGDMIGAGGGAEEASRARVRCAWSKFRELSPILTSRGASLTVKGKVFRACVQSVLVYGSETWAVKVEDMQRLERTERMMVRWMCGVTLKDRLPSVELYKRLGLEDVAVLVRRGRLRWFGHLERKSGDDWVSACRNFEVSGTRGKGRGRKTWGECVKGDMVTLSLKREWAQDRSNWRGLIWGNRPTRACTEKRTLNR